MVRDSAEASDRANGHITDFKSLRHMEELVNQGVTRA